MSWGLNKTLETDCSGAVCCCLVAKSRVTLCNPVDSFPLGSSVHGISQVLWPAQQVGIESGRHTVWEKETRDRKKVLKMGLGDSRPLGSRALFLRATSLLFSFLASRKYLLCYNEVSLLCPQSCLPFY